MYAESLPVRAICEKGARVLYACTLNERWMYREGSSKRVKMPWWMPIHSVVGFATSPEAWARGEWCEFPAYTMHCAQLSLEV
jgi:hypothetical protein